MNFNVLRAIAHNLANSPADGISSLIGSADESVFCEAARTPGGYVEVDFLTGSVLNGPASEGLSSTFAAYHRALPRLCRSHGTTPAAFRRLEARYDMTPLVPKFTVTVEDQNGRRAVDDYDRNGHRLWIVDLRGRRRRQPAIVLTRRSHP